MSIFLFYELLVFNTSDWDPETQYPKYPGEAVNNETQTQCFYRGLNEDQLPYERKDSWWHVFAARLAFVLAFQVSEENVWNTHFCCRNIQYRCMEK